MKDVLINAAGALLYTSGLLIWPLCAFLWRKKKRPTTALRWVFFAELACTMALCGVAFFGSVTLEHGYYWFILLILLNLFFTLAALGAAVYDFIRSETNAI